ncbi:MAG: hypothetical protein Q4B28_04355 [bacterium]|nr:hypothetical protein [bacterium]
MEILEKRGKTDLSGRPITAEDARSYQFAHILPKGMYPELRLNPDNIILVDSIEQHEWVDKTVAGAKAWFFDWVKRGVAIQHLNQIWNNPILHPLRAEGKLPLGSDF